MLFFIVKIEEKERQKLQFSEPFTGSVRGIRCVVNDSVAHG